MFMRYKYSALSDSRQVTVQTISLKGLDTGWESPCSGTKVFEVLRNVAGQVKLICILHMGSVRYQSVGCVGHGALIILWESAAANSHL